MNLVAQQVQAVNVREVVDNVAAAGLKLLRTHECTGENGGSATNCPFLKIVDVSHLYAAIGVGLVAHWAHDNAVFQHHVADSCPCKQFLVLHFHHPFPQNKHDFCLNFHSNLCNMIISKSNFILYRLIHLKIQRVLLS